MLQTLTIFYPMKSIQNLSEHKKRVLFLAVLWMLIVCFLCLKSSAGISINLPKNFDKLGHICFHFGITFLWILYFYSKKVIGKKIYFYPILISFLYGVFLEICQHLFTTTRFADILDVVANTIGAVLAILFIDVMFKKLK